MKRVFRIFCGSCFGRAPWSCETAEHESWEQEAVNFIFRNNLLEFTRHAAVVPNRVFNSFYHTQYRAGDFLVHFAGEAARGEGRREALIDEHLGCATDNAPASSVESPRRLAAPISS